jgi:hypothetical protein
MELVADISYRRPEPEAWSALVSRANACLGDGEGDFTPEQRQHTGRSLLEGAGTLDNESLDEARHYGLGLAMCGVAHTLRQPEARERLVGLAANILFNSWQRNNVGLAKLSAELHPADLKGHALSFVFREVVRESVAAVPLAERLALQALTLIVRHRTHGSRPGSSVDPRDVADVWEGGKAESDIAVNVLAGVAAVFQRVLEKRSGFNDKESPAATNQGRSTQSESWEHRPLSAITGSGGLAALGWERVAARCTALRLDEFVNSPIHYMGVRPDGVVFYDSSKVKPSAELGEPESAANGIVTLHRQRLQCPAVFVDGLIPMTIEFFGEAIVRAQQLVDAHNQARLKQG